MINLKKTYEYAPEPVYGELLGTEAVIWTEHISSIKSLDFMVFPRIAAIARLRGRIRTTEAMRDF